MKVLMLASRFHPHLGGVEKHLWELLSELVSRGHVCSVITERHSDDLPPRETVMVSGAEVEVFRISAGDQSGTSALSRKTCWPSLLRLRAVVGAADLVHCHDFSAFIYWYLPLRLLYPGKKVYVTFHGWEGACPPPRKAVLLRRLTELLSCGNICVGDFIGKWYGTRANFITYGAVRPVDAPLPAAGGGAVFVGRLAPDTGIMTYLEALRLLRLRGWGIPVTVCGDGPLRQECERFARENDLAARFLGFVANPMVHLSEASFVFVSGYLAILEAMSLKRLVFSVYDNALKGDYLRLIPSSAERMFIAGSPQELAVQLERILGNGKLADAMVENAHLWALTCSWGRVAGMYEELWKG